LIFLKNEENQMEKKKENEEMKRINGKKN